MPRASVKQPSQETPDSRAFRGSIQQDYIHYTNEGFGSLARNIIYPILHIAVSCALHPQISNLSYHYNSARPSYKTDLQSIADFLCIDPTCSINSGSEIVDLEVNTWNDPQIGACYGDGRAIALQLNKYLNRHDASPGCWFVIRLVGAIRCMDPTPEAFAWLHTVSDAWCKHPGYRYPSTQPNTHHDNELRIAAHVRVPEAFTSSGWKEDNHVKKLYGVLDSLFENLRGWQWTNCPALSLEIYTEEQFLIDDEQMMHAKYSTKNCAVCVYRGSTSTILQDIQHMVTADLFIPSSSHFSAFCGYLTHNIILISDPSRWEYFSPHAQLGCTLLDATTDGSWSQSIIWHEFCRKWDRRE
jgi:hypothetical protein